MIGDEQERFFDIRLLDVFESLDVHQIVSRQINPQRADVPLAECPKLFPRAAIHSVGQLVTYFFSNAQYGEFRTGGRKIGFYIPEFRVLSFRCFEDMVVVHLLSKIIMRLTCFKPGK